MPRLANPMHKCFNVLITWVHRLCEHCAHPLWTTKFRKGAANFAIESFGESQHLLPMARPARCSGDPSRTKHQCRTLSSPEGTDMSMTEISSSKSLPNRVVSLLPSRRARERGTWFLAPKISSTKRRPRSRTSSGIGACTTSKRCWMHHKISHRRPSAIRHCLVMQAKVDDAARSCFEA